MMKLDKNWSKQADLTDFALDPRDAHAPFALPLIRCWGSIDCRLWMHPICDHCQICNSVLYNI